MERHECKPCRMAKSCTESRLVKKEQIGFLNLSMERSYKKDKQYLMKIEKILFKKNQKCSKVI